MEKKTITLSVNEFTKENAKLVAKRRDTSMSKMFEEMIAKDKLEEKIEKFVTDWPQVAKDIKVEGIETNFVEGDFEDVIGSYYIFSQEYFQNTNLEKKGAFIHELRRDIQKGLLDKIKEKGFDINTVTVEICNPKADVLIHHCSGHLRLIYSVRYKFKRRCNIVK